MYTNDPFEAELVDPCCGEQGRVEKIEWGSPLWCIMQVIVSMLPPAYRRQNERTWWARVYRSVERVSPLHNITGREGESLPLAARELYRVVDIEGVARSTLSRRAPGNLPPIPVTATVDLYFHGDMWQIERISIAGHGLFWARPYVDARGEYDIHVDRVREAAT